MSSESLILVIALVPIFLYLWLRYSRIPIYVIFLGNLFFTGSSADVDASEVIIFALSLLVLVDTFYTARPGSPSGRSSLAIRQITSSYLLFLGVVIVGTLLGLISGTNFVDALRELPPFTYYMLLLTVIARLRDNRSAIQVFVVLLVVLGALLFRDFGHIVLGPIVPNVIRYISEGMGFLASVPSVSSSWYVFAFMPLLVRPANVPKPVYLLIWIMGFVGLATIVFSGTRSYWLGLAVSVVIALSASLKLSNKGKVRVPFPSQTVLPFSILVGLLILGLLLVENQSQSTTQLLLARFESIGNLQNDLSAEGRTNEIEAALDEFTQNPFFGRGLGFLLTSQLRVWQLDPYVTRGYIHSFPVYLLLKTGILGLCLFASFYGLLCRHLWLLMIRSRDTPPLLADFSGVMFLVLCAILTASVFSTRLSVVNDVITIVLLIGAILFIELNSLSARDGLRNMRSQIP